MAGNRVALDIDANDRATKKVAAVENRFTKLANNKGFATVTAGAGLGVGVGAWGLLSSAIGAGVGFMTDSIGAASNLNEQVSKSQAIFKGSAQAVETFGDSSATAFGISKREALEAAGNFGNLFTTIGLGSDVSAEMSTKLVGLASDLASFNNIDTSDALEKLRSGLAGEAEPLRTMGVLLNETQVAAEASALGFKKTNGQFTEGAKVQARYSLILKQTTSAQGDFARTGDSMANQQRKLNALMEDAQAMIGQKLLPQVRALQRTLIETAPAAGSLSAALTIFIASMTKGGNVTSDVTQLLADQAAGDKETAEATRALGLAFEESFRRSERAVVDNSKAVVSWRDSLKDSAGVVGTTYDQLAEDFHQATFVRMRSDMGITRDDIKADFKNLTDYMKNRLTEGQLRDLLSGKSSMGKELLRALRSSHGDIIGETGKIFDDIKGKMTDKQLRDLISGKNAIGKQILKDMQSSKPDVRDAAKALFDSAKEELSGRIDVIIKVTRSKTNDKGKASGGPVSAGEGYLVGERGPEFFSPAVNGTIIPAGPTAKMMSGNSLTVNFNSLWPPTREQARAAASVIDQELARIYNRAPSSSASF